MGDRSKKASEEMTGKCLKRRDQGSEVGVFAGRSGPMLLEGSGQEKGSMKWEDQTSMAWRGWLLFEEHCRRVVYFALFCFVFNISTSFREES